MKILPRQLRRLQRRLKPMDSLVFKRCDKKNTTTFIVQSHEQKKKFYSFDWTVIDTGLSFVAPLFEVQRPPALM